MRYQGIFFSVTIILMAAGALALAFAGEAAAADNYAPKCGGGKILLSADEKAVFAKQNEIRRNNDLAALCIHPDLQRAARFHSQEEIEHDYSDHRSFDGKTFYETTLERIQRFGYTVKGTRSWAAGENIFHGSNGLGDPQDAMDFWMNSSAHRANILDARYRQVGVGTASGEFAGKDGHTTYTVDFGFRRF